MPFQPRELAEQTIHPSSDRSDPYVQVAANSWNQGDIRAINDIRGGSMPLEFGRFELFAQAPSSEATVQVAGDLRPNPADMLTPSAAPFEPAKLSDNIAPAAELLLSQNDNIVKGTPTPWQR
jgi:hypothetical protein